MLVQRAQRLGRLVAQIALVRISIPRVVVGRVDNLVTRGTAWTSQHTRGVGDDVLFVVLAHVAVNSGAVGARDATAGFEMKGDGRTRDKGLAAPGSGTLECLGHVDRRGEVRIQITLALEVTLARSTIVMERRLPAVLVQPMLVLEHLAAFPAVVVVIFIVLRELPVVTEVAVAVLAICVVGALDVMLFEAQPGGEVDVTVVTDVVVGRVVFMLLEGPHAVKVTLAAVAVRHNSEREGLDGFQGKRKETTSRGLANSGVDMPARYPSSTSL